MLRDIDNALFALLRAAVPGAEIRLGAGDHDGDQAGEHGLRVLLHDVCEEQDALAAMWQDDHDTHGRVVARRHPVRRYRLRYLVFAIAADAATEHDWLGRVLVALAAHQVVPPDLLTGVLADAGLSVPLRVAPPDLPEPALTVLTAVGTHPALEVAVLAPCVQPEVTVLPPAPDTVDLGIADRVPPRAPRGRVPGPVGRRIREGSGG